MNVRYIVTLTEEERRFLEQLISRGKEASRTIKRANILLMADHRRFTDDQIAEALTAGRSTVFRVRKRFVEEGVEAAIHERKRPGGLRKLGPNEEAILVAAACSKPPTGRSRWTLQLLADRVVALTEVDSLSADTVARRLRDNKLKPWQKKMWCIPTVDVPFIVRMEDVLDLYAEPHDPKRPVVCIDEGFKQLVGETRIPIPCKPGQPERYDYEYVRNGTANLYVMLDRHRGWRHVKVTRTKGNTDYAHLLRDLVDIHYPDAEVVRVVHDNLNTHCAEVLYKTFEPAEARRILRKLEFHHTPKHASWLNMVEIEIGVMTRQCLDRRIPDHETLETEIEAWQQERNAARATIDWMFDVDRARTKLRRAYPDINVSSSLR